MSALHILEQSNCLNTNNIDVESITNISYINNSNNKHVLIKPLLKPKAIKSMTSVNKRIVKHSKTNSANSFNSNEDVFCLKTNDISLNSFEDFQKELNEQLVNEKDNETIFEEISLIFKESKFNINKNELRRSVPLTMTSNNNSNNNLINIPSRCSNPFSKNF